MVPAFLANLATTPRSYRLRLIGWGVAAAGLVALIYAPVAVTELTSGHPEITGIAGYLAAPPGYVSVSPAARVLFATIRVAAWPLVGWPYFEMHAGFLLAALTALALYVALGLLVYRAWRQRRTVSGGEVPARTERFGLLFVTGSLMVLILGLGLLLRSVSELNISLNEHYHMTVDPLVVVGAGVSIGALWRVRPSRAVLAPIGRIAAVILVVASVAWNAAHWPPLDAPDGGWAAAQAAAARIESDAAGGSIALVGLPSDMNPDAYRFPLVMDGLDLVDPSGASVVVVLCDMRAVDDCGGAAEGAWAATAPEASGLSLVERFQPAPDRWLSVYRR